MHLYRGELARMTAYRARLDTTTNWALGATVAVLSFVLGDPDAPAHVLLIPYALNLIFAFIEARRFQDFETSRHRVRLMERGLYAPQMGAPDDPTWAAELGRSLRAPQAPLSLARALAHRMRRNYLWLLLVVAGGWALHLPHRPTELELAVVGGLVLPWALLALFSRPIEHG